MGGSVADIHDNITRIRALDSHCLSAALRLASTVSNFEWIRSDLRWTSAGCDSSEIAGVQ